MRLRLDYFWLMGSPEVDSRHPLCAAESIRTSHSAVCSPFLMDFSPSKPSSIMTGNHHRPGDQIQASYLRLLSLFLEVAETCPGLGTVNHSGRSHCLKPMVLLEAYSDPSFFVLGLASVESDHFCNFVAFCNYFLLPSVLLSLFLPFLFNEQNKIKWHVSIELFYFSLNGGHDHNNENRREKGLCRRCKVGVMQNGEITRSVPRSPSYNDEHFRGTKRTCTLGFPISLLSSSWARYLTCAALVMAEESAWRKQFFKFTCCLWEVIKIFIYK